MTRIAVLGSGMAGYGAFRRLSEEGVGVTVFEKKPYPGGHTASYATGGGFLFDDGPHISFTRDERIQELLAANVGGEYEVLQARVNNHWRGHWIKHPAQCNLHGLPEDLVVAVLEDFVAASRTDPPREIGDYESWLRAAYGDTFAETFPMEYGEKYHTAPARRMSTDWLGPRLYRPELSEVLRGALSPQTADVHYVDHFRYPSRGGFQAYLKPFFDAAEIRLEHEVVEIDPRRGRVRCANGVDERFDGIVTSIPLPGLVPLVGGAPPEVLEAAARLACTTCVLVNLGVARSDLSEHHWTYFYDRDYTVTRVSFPHLFSPHNAPAGSGSIQAEVYFSDKYRPLTVSPESLVAPVIADLERCGVLAADDRIVHREAALVPWANVIFDHDRVPALAVVHGFLDEMGLAYCGRYGEWGYHWTDEALLSGERAAQRLLDRLGRGSPVRGASEVGSGPTALME